jgi:hypothetical protein
MPTAAMPVIDAARMTMSMLSTVRNAGVVAPPTVSTTITASATEAGTTSFRRSTFASKGYLAVAAGAGSVVTPVLPASGPRA